MDVKRPMKRRPAGMLGWLLLVLAAPAAALDVVTSGFGTIGYAISDRSYAYERYIDDHGSFERDSVLGLQFDASLNTQWSATLQLKAAPSVESDSRWEVRPAWAFIGWRPSNDWLVRAGRLRVSLYMHSESLDVGVTRDTARLSTEMYSIVPTNDFNGLSIGKSWQQGDSDLSLEVYSGRISSTLRMWLRDGAPGLLEPGASFYGIDVRTTGIVFGLRHPGGQWRVSFHHATTRRGDGQNLPVTFPFVAIAPGVGYYQVDPAIPGPGVESVPRISSDLITLGVEQQLPGELRLAVEFARNVQHDTVLGSNTRGGYVALFRPFGDVTPYVSVGALRSSSAQLDWYERLTTTQVPAAVPNAALINAAQRVAAESLYVIDQRSVALGAAWSLGPHHKVKGEWKRTRIGRVSRLVDTSAGSADVRDTNIDILSVSYNFAF